MSRAASAGLVLAACAAAAAARGADDLARRFAWRQPIETPGAAGTLYRARLPPEVFDGARFGPDRDLRVIDAGGRQWPFFVRAPATSGSLWTPVPARALNRSRVEAPEPYVRWDVAIEPSPDGRPVEHDRVRVTMPGTEFIRRVDVLGSDDGATWGRLGEGYVVRHRRDVAVESHVVRYAPSIFRHLQVRIRPDPRLPGDPPEPDAVDVLRDATPSVELADVPLQPVEASPEDVGEGRQTLVFDAGYARQEVEEIEVEAAGEYVRPVAVYARDAATSDWRRAASGEIQSLGGARRGTLRAGMAGRYWRVDVFRYDDAPLAEVRVRARARPKWLVFEAASGDPAALYYGADRVPAPSYDLVRRAHEGRIAASPEVRLGPREPNPLAGAPPWTERLPRIFVPAGIGAASVIVLAVILRMLSRVRTGA